MRRWTRSWWVGLGTAGMRDAGAPERGEMGVVGETGEGEGAVAVEVAVGGGLETVWGWGAVGAVGAVWRATGIELGGVSAGFGGVVCCRGGSSDGRRANERPAAEAPTQVAVAQSCVTWMRQ